MARESVFLQFLLIVLVTGLFGAFEVPGVEAYETPIYIRVDGSIEPPTASISTDSNVTYTFTDNIDFASIVVERDNIVIDGDGHTLQGLGIQSDTKGIELSRRTNVTVQNVTIKAFHSGIRVGEYSSNNKISGNIMTTSSGNGIFLGYYSSNNMIIGNNITANGGVGIHLYYSFNNTVSGNSITANDRSGIWLDNSSSNTISGNNITDNAQFSSYGGISFYGCSNNTVSGNDIANNSQCGIWFYSSFNNTIYHNNFVDNLQQVNSDNLSYFGSVNVWDDGYPSGGNCWSDYNGTDADHDGIGDTPYVIDAENVDRYPLTMPYVGLKGDINTDGKVDMKDVGYVSRRFMCVPEDSLWDSRADLNSDGRINMIDIGIVANHYGERYP